MIKRIESVVYKQLALHTSSDIFHFDVKDKKWGIKKVHKLKIYCLKH